MKLETPCCLPQHSRALSMNLEADQGPGSGSGVPCTHSYRTKLMCSAALLRLCFEGTWVPSGHFFYALEIWMPATLLSAKWRNNTGREESFEHYYLKVWKVFFLTFCILDAFSVDRKTWCESSGNLPSLSSLLRLSDFHPLIPLGAVLSGRTCFWTCF